MVTKVHNERDRFMYPLLQQWKIATNEHPHEKLLYSIASVIAILENTLSVLGNQDYGYPKPQRDYVLSFFCFYSKRFSRMRDSYSLISKTKEIKPS